MWWSVVLYCVALQRPSVRRWLWRSIAWVVLLSTANSLSCGSAPLMPASFLGGCLTVSSVPGAPLQLRLHFYIFTQWPLRASLQGLCPCHSCLASATFWNHGQDSMNLLVLRLSCVQNQYHVDAAAKFCCQLHMEPGPLGHSCSSLCVPRSSFLSREPLKLYS